MKARDRPSTIEEASEEDCSEKAVADEGGDVPVSLSERDLQEPPSAITQTPTIHNRRYRE